jgi:pimeloyl-ACP methyl ester carboxylesterase
MVVTGTEDIISPPANAFMLASRIPGSWLVQFKGAGHGLMYQYPEKLARIIVTFLET